MSNPFLPNISQHQTTCDRCKKLSMQYFADAHRFVCADGFPRDNLSIARSKICQTAHKEALEIQETREV